MTITVSDAYFVIRTKGFNKQSEREARVARTVLGDAGWVALRKRQWATRAACEQAFTALPADAQAVLRVTEQYALGL